MQTSNREKKKERNTTTNFKLLYLFLFSKKEGFYMIKAAIHFVNAATFL
jgi:hypothetical protein